VNDVADGDLLMRHEDFLIDVTFESSLVMTILSPAKTRIDALRKKWKKDLKSILEKEAGQAPVDAAAFADSSVFNLASTMVFAQRGDKTMLLTGDGRGDDLIDGLEAAGLLENGKIQVDVFKLPHHGSNRNVTAGLFEAITARHYLISANGEHDNPDVDTLDMLAQGRKAARNDAFTVHFTFPDRAFALISEAAANRSQKVRKQKDALQRVDDWVRTKKPANMTAAFRDPSMFSTAVDLDSEKVF